MDFERWSTNKKSSNPYKVFNQYNTEMKRMYMSYEASKKYTYSSLGKENAQWKDEASKYLYTSKENKQLTVKEWSNSFEMYDNWVRLNNLMAISSYFETFLSSVVKLALESDPALYIGKSQCVDGIQLLKQGKRPFKKRELEEHVKNCTKGDWTQRANYFKRLFGSIPETLQKGLSSLEKIRILRNSVGHAFGRDIKLSRDYSLLKITPMKKLSAKTLKRYHFLIQKCAQEIDSMLMTNHIGNFQYLYAYHQIKNNFKPNLPLIDRANMLKKHIGRVGAEPVSKQFCLDAVKYYDSL